MHAIAMAFEVNMLAAVQSSQSRIAIRESCTRICLMIFWESFKTQYSQYCYASALFTSQYCYAMALLTSQLEHTRNLNYQFLQFATFPLQWRSDAHHSSVYIFFNLVSDVIAISLSTCYHHTFYPMRSEEEILRHFNMQHRVLITEVVQRDISKHEPRLLRTKYLWI